MAKLALLFVAIFCIVQICLAAKISKRDTAQPQTDLAQTLQTEFEKIKKQVEEALTKENIEKLSKNIEEFGNKLKEGANDLLNKAQSAQKSD